MAAFESAEYDSRIDKITAQMRDREIDILLVSDPGHIHYLTGYNAWSFYAPQAAILTRDGTPIWVGRDMDVAAAKATTWLPNEHIIGYEDHHIWQSEPEHPIDFMADIVQEISHPNPTLGIEMGSYYFPAQYYTKLKQNLQNTVLKDATRLISEVRTIKSDAELEFIGQASGITDRMFDTAIDMIEPGVREFEVIAEIYKTMIEGTPDAVGEYSAVTPVLPTGNQTNTPHVLWTSKKLQEGEPVILEASGVTNRYHCPLARTMYIGDPPDEFLALADATERGLDAALTEIRPGLRCQDVARVFQDTIEEYGYQKESRLGYTAGGATFPPTWQEGYWECTANIAPGDTTRLREGMTFHIIAGMWEDEYGVELSETVRVTETGMETFSDIPHELIIKHPE